jgi:hypothetical protein
MCSGERKRILSARTERYKKFCLSFQQIVLNQPSACRKKNMEIAIMSSTNINSKMTYENI